MLQGCMRTSPAGVPLSKSLASAAVTVRKQHVKKQLVTIHHQTIQTNGRPLLGVRCSSSSSSPTAGQQVVAVLGGQDFLYSQMNGVTEELFRCPLSYISWNFKRHGHFPAMNIYLSSYFMSIYPFVV